MNAECDAWVSVPASLRLFVAVRLPPAWLDALAADQQRLRGELGQAAAALRWVRPESCHITLVFLGQVASPREQPLCEALNVAAGASRRFDLRLAGLAAFGGRLPRVIFREVDGELVFLHALQRRVVTALDIRRQAPFRAHITLARVEPRRSGGLRPAAIRDALRAAIAVAPGRQAPAHRVEAIALMASAPQPGGAVHTERCVAPLQGKS